MAIITGLMCVILIHPERSNYSVFFAEQVLPRRSDSAASAINIVDFKVNSEKDIQCLGSLSCRKNASSPKSKFSSRLQQIFFTTLLFQFILFNLIKLSLHQLSIRRNTEPSSTCLSFSHALQQTLFEKSCEFF